MEEVVVIQTGVQREQESQAWRAAKSRLNVISIPGPDRWKERSTRQRDIKGLSEDFKDER